MFSSKPRVDSPVKASWFEFLLDPSLLEKHLDQDSPDPSPTELIINFLSNCSLPVNEQNNGNNNSNGKSILPVFGPPNIYDENFIDSLEVKDEPESKKKLALKLLALKVAAFLKWDLNLLRKKLPLHMQQVLLWELLKVAGNEMTEKNVLSKNGFDELSPDARFARILYYIWILQAVVEDSYMPKYSRGMNLQIPGQNDPAVVSPAVVDSIMKKLNEESDDATAMMEECVKAPLTVRLPLFRCFMHISNENNSPSYRWDQGFILQNDEVICQISYSLGRFYFFQERYEQASEHFIRASDLYQQCQYSIFCKLDRTKLQGFYNACAHLLGFNTLNASTSLKECLQSSVASGHPETVNILRSDNLRRELPLSIRDSVEMNVLQERLSDAKLVLNVSFSNVIRHIVDGKIVMSDWYSLLKMNEEECSLIFCDLLKDVIPTCSQRQKLFVKNFVRFLCLTSIHARILLKKHNVLSSLLSDEEIELILCHDYHPLKEETLKLEKNFTSDPSVQVGLLERRLLSTIDPDSIKFLVTQLRSKFGRNDLCSLNKQWELPRPVAIFLKNTSPHALSQVDVEMVQIFIAKSNELRAIKKYDDSQNLCKSVNREIQNDIPRLSRYLLSESLRLDLLKVLDAPVYICQPSSLRTEIVQRILSFLSCINDREQPDANLLELCAAVLLNFREWDKIVDLRPGFGSYFEFSKVVSFVCKELFISKGNRNCSRELWEIVLPIFSNMTQHKRTNSGVIKDSSREYSPAIISKAALQAFVKKLKDTSCLGVIISCLAKFYNILKDDSIGEIFLEYSGLWPSTVANSVGFNMSSVGEAFQGALHHALSVHPTHSAWLRTKGDVMYVQCHYSSALKFYLSAAMVSTDYFYQTLPKVLFDDLMFKHMIHCCTKLHNHTQSAVLHQFLEDPNYQGAFKALCERICYDSCDVYYDCIWDVTFLEFLINLHSKRSELDYRLLVMQLIGQLELNANNNDEIQREAANLRRGRFLRAMAKQFL